MKENQRLEWKETWRDEYLRWICGFANAEGGTLVIGKNDKGVPVGVANARRLIEELPNKIRDLLGVIADVRLVRVGGAGLRPAKPERGKIWKPSQGFHQDPAGKELVEIKVAAYPSPISYKGEYHYRSGGTNQMLKGNALDRFLLRKHGRTWDGVPVPHVHLRDLSKDAIAGFRKLAKQSRRLDASSLQGAMGVLLEKLNLVEKPYLKRAALLLFHPEPDRQFIGAFVKIGYFQTESDLLYHDEIHGDLFTQTQKTMELLTTKYLKGAISYRGIQRIESLPVPESALREAVLNAIIHRDYAVGAPIQIRVYPDRLAIWNPGELPERWSMKKLLGPHSSHPYNPLVANAFFRAGEIEAWGRGIQHILDACREAGMPEPRLQFEPGDIWVEFPFGAGYLGIVPAASAAREGGTRPGSRPESRPESASVKTPAQTPVEPSVKASVETSVKTSEPSVKASVKTSVKILELLQGRPEMTLAEVAAVVGRSVRAVELASSKLVKDGRLRYVGSQKGGHWEVLK